MSHSKVKDEPGLRVRCPWLPPRGVIITRAGPVLVIFCSCPASYEPLVFMSRYFGRTTLVEIGHDFRNRDGAELKHYSRRGGAVTPDMFLALLPLQVLQEGKARSLVRVEPCQN
jgi:hypothetical protein